MNNILFTAWGPSPGHEYEGSIGGLCDTAKAAGIKTVALQVGMATPRHADEVRGRGMQVGAWGVFGAESKAAVEELKPDIIIPQIEGDGQRESAMAFLATDPRPGAPRAVVTTYGGLDSATKWANVARFGVSLVLVECYAADDPTNHANLQRMLWQGTQYGIPAAALHGVCGVYRGEVPNSYQLSGELARGIGLYLAEQMSGAQWIEWRKALIATPLPVPADVLNPYWDVVSGNAILHSERAKTYSPGDDGLGRALLWAVNNRALIRTAKSATIRWTQR